MIEPKRIHLTSRFMPSPPNTKRVKRPSRFGNPHKVGSPGVPDQLTAVRLFERDLANDPEKRALICKELRGFSLACTCKPNTPCHADVLLRIANGEDM